MIELPDKPELQWKPYYDPPSERIRMSDPYSKRTDIIMLEAWAECVLFNDSRKIGDKVHLTSGKTVTVSQQAHVIAIEPYFACHEFSYPVRLSEIYQ